MKVVLDANILASGIFWGGQPLKILELWKGRKSKDDMFIDCAIAGKSRYIVSGDQDLLVLKQVMSVSAMFFGM
jgi:predicted nucleic acid-binding protein